MNAKKKILVTGGAGFIGSHLCERLLSEGNSIICVDNLSSAVEQNISYLSRHTDFVFIRHDIQKRFNYSVSEIYNLACPASPVQYQSDPVNTIKTNLLGMINVLELARTNGAKVLQASTSEVYGDALSHPQKESYWGNVNPIGPRSCYDEGKRCAETLCFDYQRQYGLDVRVPRIFNTYGPRMLPTDGRVVSNLILQALNNEPLTIYGNGNQTRSFCYVEDLVDGLISVMKCSTCTAPINIGSTDEISIYDLAQKIIHLSKSSSKIIFRELPSDDPCQRCPDLSEIKEKIQWKPMVSLDKGLTKTINYFSHLGKKYDADQK